MLATGTDIVPGMDFTLRDGDTVRIEIEDVGVLTNPVVGEQSQLDWLVEAVDQPLLRRDRRAR